MKFWGIAMTVKDTVLIFTILSAAYPFFYKDIRHDDQQMGEAIAVWNEMLAEYDVNTVKFALKRLIAIQKDYPPTIGQLLESINIVSGNAAPDADEIWQEIMNAIRGYGFYGTVKAMESLSPLAREVVRVMDWYTLCMSENPETDRAHFLRIYQAIKTRHDQKYTLPNDVRAYIAAHTAGDKLSVTERNPYITDDRKKEFALSPVQNIFKCFELDLA